MPLLVWYEGKQNTWIYSFGLATIVLLKWRRSIPKNVVAVKPFFVEKYLAKWYEIARFDFRFESGLNNTTAEYSLNKGRKY